MKKVEANTHLLTRKCILYDSPFSTNYFVKISCSAFLNSFRQAQNLYNNAISNSNWTEWSTIQGVIARVISKSDEPEVRGRFEITSTITPWIVRHEVQLLINRIYNKFQN